MTSKRTGIKNLRPGDLVFDYTKGSHRGVTVLGYVPNPLRGQPSWQVHVIPLFGEEGQILPQSEMVPYFTKEYYLCREPMPGREEAMAFDLVPIRKRHEKGSPANRIDRGHMLNHIDWAHEEIGRLRADRDSHQRVGIRTMEELATVRAELALLEDR